jgi:putative acetyltransferase
MQGGSITPKPGGSITRNRAVPRRGIGSLLMKRIFAHAISGGVRSLTSYVSRTAQPFLARFEFMVVEQRSPEVRRVVIPNALMSRRL